MDQRATMSQRARMRTQACDQDVWINGEIKTDEVLINVVKFALKAGLIPWMDQVDIKTGEVLIKDDEFAIKFVKDAVKFGEVCVKEMVEYVFE